MPTPTQILQHQIPADERALRLLIGEEAALKSKTARLQGKLKLERTRLAALLRAEHSAKLTPGTRFVDFSNNNAGIDVAKIRQLGGSVRARDFVVSKLTEGTGFVDAPGVTRLRAAFAAGFPVVGAYCYLHPSESGKEQALKFLSVLNANKLPFIEADYIIADLEQTDGRSAAQVRACAADFSATIAEHSPSKRWLYGGGPFLKQNGVQLGDPTKGGYHAHWLAAYVGDFHPFLAYPLARTAAWQFTDGRFGPMPHACPGVPGGTDMSILL